MTPEELVGRNLVRLRRARGYTQEQLQASAEVTQAYLSGLESGSRNPTVTILVRLARALEVSVSELTEGLDDTTPKTKTQWPKRPAST
jgi:transcriptional regulator with XRE-family HTH domain